MFNPNSFKQRKLLLFITYPVYIFSKCENPSLLLFSPPILKCLENPGASARRTEAFIPFPGLSGHDQTPTLPPPPSDITRHASSVSTAPEHYMSLIPSSLYSNYKSSLLNNTALFKTRTPKARIPLEPLLVINSIILWHGRNTVPSS